MDEIRFTTHFCGIPPDVVYRMVTEAPSTVLRLEDAEGSIRVSGIGDLIAVRDTDQDPADRLQTLSMVDVEFVMIAGRVQLASAAVFERLPSPVKQGMEPLWVDGTARWLRAPVKKLLQKAEEVLEVKVISAAGRQADLHTEPWLFPRGGHIMSELDVREAYRLWAPTYAAETATSFLDEELAQQMLRGLPRTRLLDAGCGVGRRIAEIPGAVGIDLSPELLATRAAREVVTGDVRAMPFASDCYDMVWCRLVLGHLPDPLRAYLELARVCTPGGYVFVTDFHPDAVAAGHRRSFHDQAGSVHEVEHYVHNNHKHLAVKAGLAFVASCDGVVGPSIRDFYVRGGRLDAYERDTGLKLIAAFLFHRSDRFN